MRQLFLTGSLAMLALSLMIAAAPGPDADVLYKQKNYRQAALAYARQVKENPHRAFGRQILCYLRLRDFDAAIKVANQYIQYTANSPDQAIAHRLVGNLYLTLPHWGTRAGGQFYRAQRKQGLFLQSHRHDRRMAIQHLQKARQLYADYDGKTDRPGWHRQRLDCLFDLASANTRFNIFETQPFYWFSFWGQRDDGRAQTAGEDDFDEQQSDWQWHRKRPVGLRVDAAGKPIFPTMPAQWAEDLPDDQKVLFLLQEIRSLDTTPNRELASLSWYRQAMLARSRFGLDRMRQYANMVVVNQKKPLEDQIQSIKPWELEDSQTIVLAAGRMHRATLPDAWNVLTLLEKVQANLRDQAAYATGLYHQSRQQYGKALTVYDAMPGTFPKSRWLTAARKNATMIRQPQVQLLRTGVQLTGQKASLQLSYRNIDRVWFVARKIDLPGLFQTVRHQPFNPEKGFNSSLYDLQAWPGFFTNNYGYNQPGYKLIKDHIGPEVARWSAPLKPSPDHRYATTTLQSPLTSGGVYLVYAYLQKPPQEHATYQGPKAISQGQSRAVILLTDLAIVEKKTPRQRLYFLSDARTGKPASNVKLSIMQTWNTWDRKKRVSIYHRKFHHLTTDSQGLAQLAKAKPGSQLQLVAQQGERFAYTGMRYWSASNPASQAQSNTAYCMTDRPVYRPGQNMQFKIWLRQWRNGQWRNTPNTPASITIYDPRGNQAYSHNFTTDAYGAIHGQFKLDEQAILGVYRINLSGYYRVSGQTFRVEEYKKPQFQVTVKPSTTHAKLGQPIQADIHAQYYFGQPVAKGTVTYRIFRQTYTHHQFLPGRWDWLYGQGYGLSWYESPWFDFWPIAKRCFVAPEWWYGWYPYAYNKPVRQLVRQGSGKLDEQGNLHLNISTEAALRDHPDQDHLYSVEAEVRDPSRRVITGKGQIKVTRQAYYAFIQPNQGYYKPGEQINLTLQCVTPSGTPIQTKGILSIKQVTWIGPGNTQIQRKQLDQITIQTDAQGKATLQFRYEKSGQLQFHFTAPDAWGQQVHGYALVWVCGTDFDGKLHRFNDLEIISDQRTYQPGQTAHLLINTRQPDSYVLLSTDAESGMWKNWKMIHIPGRSKLIDVPITENHKPDFFVEALTVRHGRVFQQIQRLCVPPAQAVLDVAIRSEKPNYEPGEQATIHITTTGPDGQPAQAQLTLAAFDKALLYIQQRTNRPIAGFYHGRLRYHAIQMTTNLLEQFTAWGWIYRPFQSLYSPPPSWYGDWGPQISDWHVISDEDMKQLAGSIQAGAGNAVFLGSKGMRRTRMAKSMAAAPQSLSSRSGVSEMPSADMAMASGMLAKSSENKKDHNAAETLAPPSLRRKFADTAMWRTQVTTDKQGQATVHFTVPDNLTTWQIQSWAMTKNTQVGEARTSAISTKKLLVQLQSPRFFVERDELVLSATIHNNLTYQKQVTVQIQLPMGLIALVDPDRQTRHITVKASGQARVDWHVRVLKEGDAKITVKALTDEVSDAMAMTLPVLVHGMMQQVATTGSMRPGELDKTMKVQLTLPVQRRGDQTELEVRFAPSLVGAMLDALPYCLEYPYGCTEQTVSRFLPAVLTQKTLQNMHLDLSTLREVKSDRHPKDRWRRRYTDSPVFDSAELDRIVGAGLKRIAAMQNSDGGWGWWKSNASYPYLTSYVLYALVTSRQAGVHVDQNMITRGINWLAQSTFTSISKKYWQANAQTAFAAYVLSLEHHKGKWVDRLMTGRDTLNLYGKALLCLTLANLDRSAEASLVLENIMEYRKDHPLTQVTWFPTPGRRWWYWYNSDIETNAWILRAIVRVNPKHAAAPGVVKWLINNRRNGYYWRSTRDTAICVHAISDFVNATDEASPDYTLTLELDDGKLTQTFKINSDNWLTGPNRFVVPAKYLTGTKHTLRITKQGKGALYFNTYLKFFGMQESIPASGHELHVQRTYYHLKQIPFGVKVDNANGSQIIENRLRYQRIPLETGDPVKSGDLIQVELKLQSDNDYTYLAVEDPKPAGCEPVQLQSGGKGQEGFYSYMQLRDQATTFFIQQLGEGDHLVRYRLRAEVPGKFHTLPTKLFGMYTPRLKANSHEHILRIMDVDVD